MAEQNATTLVGFKVDTGSVTSAVTANQRVAASYKDIAAAAAGVGLSIDEFMARTGVQVAGANDRVTQSNAKVAQSNVQVADSYRKVKEEAERATRIKLPGDPNGAATGFGTLRSAAAGLGTLGLGSAGGQAAALIGLAVEMGPLGAVAGVATLAVSKLNEEVARLRKEAEDAADKLKERAEIVASGATSEDVIERRDRLQSAQDVVTRQLERLQEQRDFLRTIIPDNNAETAARIRQSASIATGGPGDDTFLKMQEVFRIASQIAGTDIKDFAQFQRAIEEVALKSIDYGTGILNLNNLLVSGELQANDTAAAWEELKGKLAEATPFSDAIADALERVAATTELVTQQTDNYFEALDALAQIQDEIAEATAKITEIERERDERLLEIAEDQKERRAEIEAESAERIQQIVADSADRIARIERDFGRSRLDAVRRRDVGALIAARETTEDALDDEAKSQKKQIDQQRRSLEKQETQIEKSGNKQVEAVIKSTNKQIDIQQRGLVALQVDQQNAVNAAINIAQNGSGGVVTIQHNMWSEVTSITQAGAAAVRAAIGSIFDGLIGGAGGIGPGGIGGIFGSNGFNNAVDARVRSTLAQVYS